MAAIYSYLVLSCVCIPFVCHLGLYARIANIYIIVIRSVLILPIYLCHVVCRYRRIIFSGFRTHARSKMPIFKLHARSKIPSILGRFYYPKLPHQTRLQKNQSQRKSERKSMRKRKGLSKGKGSSTPLRPSFLSLRKQKGQGGGIHHYLQVLVPREAKGETSVKKNSRVGRFLLVGRREKGWRLVSG